MYVCVGGLVSGCLHVRAVVTVRLCVFSVCPCALPCVRVVCVRWFAGVFACRAVCICMPWGAFPVSICVHISV